MWSTTRRGPPGDGSLDGGLALQRPRGLNSVRRFSHEAMATVFEVYAEHADEQYAAQAAAAAFELVDRLEGELSRFLPNSDVGRINRLAAGDRTQVCPSTMECLVIARHLFDLTGGAFDISIGTGLPSLELDPENFIAHATRAGVVLDLGGIGKGYAVDRMADQLDEWGLTRALVHAGFSSMLALDAPAGGDGWPLTLSDPGTPSRVLARLSVRQAALGASGVRKGAHIMDPRSGEPANGPRAAWVAIPRPSSFGSQAVDELQPRAAAVADALTTAFMLMSVSEIEALCDRSPGLETWILPAPAGNPQQSVPLLHFGGSPPEASGDRQIRDIL